MTRTWAYIFLMALVTFAIRALPMTLIRRQIKDRFIRSFLYYVPYTTLAVMTFPAIIECTGSIISGYLALVIGIFAAYKRVSLVGVAVICCLVVLISEFIVL